MSLDWSRYPNFTEAEMRCKCGCGRCDMDPEFMSKLQILRWRYDAPLLVASAYRCPDYNARISPTGRGGPHTTGKAVDITVSGKGALRLLALVAGGSFTGIGINQKNSGRFIHLDTLTATEAPRPNIWSY